MIHTQLYLMSVSILGEQEKNNDGSDDSLTWCVLSTQTVRQTDLLSLTCVSATSMRLQSRNIPEQDKSDRKCCFSLCYFIDLWLFPEGNKIGNARNTGAFAYCLYLLTTWYHFVRRQRFNSNTYWCLHVKWPIIFPILIKYGFSGQIFITVPKNKFHVNSCGSRATISGWTDRHHEYNRRFTRLCERA